MKGKTEKWREAEMPDKCVPAKDFRPTSGNDPFLFTSCHGKELEKRLRVNLHDLVGGSTAEIQTRLYVNSTALVDPIWEDAISSVMSED
ncbi:MAG: hypothetical protein ACJASZ_002870 [Yoonia sp.]|jgi:hypothetical protein